MHILGLTYIYVHNYMGQQDHTQLSQYWAGGSSILYMYHYLCRPIPLFDGVSYTVVVVFRSTLTVASYTTR